MFSFWSAVLLLALSAGAFAQADDPRCTGVVCGADGPFAPGLTTDPTTCAYGACPRCLVGAEWEAQLAEVGAGLATRTFQPTMVFNDWLSAEIAQTAFRIILEEAMTFDVEPAPFMATGFDVLCCEKDVIMVERWAADPMPDDEGVFSLVQLPIGYEGGAGLFVSRQTVDAFPLATSFNAYKFLPDYQNIFPRGNSTPCEELIVDPDLGCVPGNFHCDDNPWTNTSCTLNGRYVPPQCEDDPTSCQEIYLATPQYDPGFFESLIRNTGLKMVAVYLGVAYLPVKVRADVAAGRHIMFFSWEPDSLVSSVGGRAVIFDPPTLECQQRQRPDPSTSGGDCDYGREPIRKVARRSSLAQDADFRFFFDSFQLSATQLSAMLAQHNSAGGNGSVYDLSCGWVRDNFGTWKDWVRNTVPEARASSDSTNGAIVGAAVGVPLGLLLLAAAAFGVHSFLQHRKVMYAPKDATRFCSMFVALKRETLLWERCGHAMPKVMLRAQALARSAAQRSKCYVVKSVGGATLIVASTPQQILDCAVAVAEALQGVDWDTMVTEGAPPEQPARKRARGARDASASDSDTATGKSDGSSRHQRSNSHRARSRRNTETKGADDTRSGVSSHSASRHSAVDVEFAIGVHCDVGFIARVEDRNAYDYGGPSVEGAAVASDRACGHQILVTNSVERGTYGAQCFTEFCTSAWGKETTLLQFNPPSLPVRSFDAAKGDADGDGANVDSIAAILEQQSAGVTIKKVAVASVYLHQLEVQAQTMARDAFAKMYAEKLVAITAIIKGEKGHLHGVVGARLIVTFNAAAPTPQAALRALSVVEQIRELEAREGDVLAVSAGIACEASLVGKCAVGDKSYDVLVSRAAELAALLQRTCRTYDGVTCLAPGSLLEELACFAFVEVVDVVQLPDAARPRLLLALRGLKPQSEDDMEWMYAGFSAENADEYTATNAIFERLMSAEGRLPAAELGELLAAASEAQRAQHGFRCLQAVHERMRAATEPPATTAASTSPGDRPITPSAASLAVSNYIANRPVLA